MTVPTSTADFYVVQKCWYDGPHVEPPIDYLRLFTTLAEAEEVALHSAYAYAESKCAVVRTILLPPSTQRGSAYAYSAAGKLFWVRKVVGIVQLSEGQHQFNLQPSTATPPAHAVLTAGVIGGTGNPSSRRGSEVCEGRVFVGLHSSQWALQVAQSLKKSGTYVSWIATSAPPMMMQGWPDYPTSWNVPAHVLEQQNQQQLHNSKREWTEFDAALSSRSAKRHCLPKQSDSVNMMHYHHHAVPELVQTQYMSM